MNLDLDQSTWVITVVFLGIFLYISLHIGVKIEYWLKLFKSKTPEDRKQIKLANGYNECSICGELFPESYKWSGHCTEKCFENSLTDEEKSLWDEKKRLKVEETRLWHEAKRLREEEEAKLQEKYKIEGEILRNLKKQGLHKCWYCREIIPIETYFCSERCEKLREKEDDEQRERELKKF
ncbi:MAG TPA: hypothetical protein PKL31_11110 [Fulvivirga sp.]|nr:hypothetical protein [Fulvivirga sp.]